MDCRFWLIFQRKAMHTQARRVAKRMSKWGHVHTQSLKLLEKSAAHAQRRPTCTEKAKLRQRLARIREWAFILHSPPAPNYSEINANRRGYGLA